MRRALSGLRTALTALSIVPAGRFEPDPPAAVGWYPWVGWLFAAAGVGVAWMASAVSGGPLGSLLTGVLIVAAWAALSRLLHWDGLADTVDGLLGGHTPERRLEIMGDSSVGAFGSFAVTLAVLTQVACLAVLVASRQWWAIAAAPVWGRFAASLCVLTRRPARGDGLGASASSGFSAAALVWAALAVMPTFAMARGIGPVAVAAAGVAAALLTGSALTRPVGGYTGDVLGASVVSTETAVLFAAAVWQLAVRGAL